MSILATKYKDCSMTLLTEDFVLEVFESEGCYLSDSADISTDKFCDETPEIIRKSILDDTNNDIKNVLEALSKHSNDYFKKV